MNWFWLILTKILTDSNRLWPKFWLILTKIVTDSDGCKFRSLPILTQILTDSDWFWTDPKHVLLINVWWIHSTFLTFNPRLKELFIFGQNQSKSVRIWFRISQNLDLKWYQSESVTILVRIVRDQPEFWSESFRISQN